MTPAKDRCRLHLLFLLTWLVAMPFCYAQTTYFSLTGKLIDRETSDAIPYASMRVQGKALGVNSNIDGEFDLRLPDSLLNNGYFLMISAVGYQNNIFKLTNLKPDSVYTIYLRPNSYQTSEVLISSTARTGKELIAEAYRRIPLNYSTSPYTLQMFYRHYCIEGDTYGRLIEAAVEVYDGKGHKLLYPSPPQKVQLRVKQLRRSFDFTSLSGRSHLPIALYSMLKRDLSSYDYVLHTEPDAFTYRLRDTTMYDGDAVFVIDFEQKVGFQEQQMFAGFGPNDSLIKRGSIWLNAADLAILQAEFFYKAQYVEDTSFFKQERHQVIAYRKHEDKYYLSHLVNDGYDDEPSMLPHRYHIEMMTNNIVPDSLLTPFKGGEPSRDQLNGIGYNPNFWDEYSILKATPLEDQIAADLAARLPLEDQFVNFNRLQTNPDSLNAIQTSQYDKLVNAYRGRLLYVLFWNSANKASVRELMATRDLAYQYMSLGVTFFFISTDEDEAKWEKARLKYAPTVGEHLHASTGGDSQLLKRFGIETLPHHFVIAPNGHYLTEEVRPPTDRKLYLQLQTIMRGEWKEEGGNL